MQQSPPAASFFPTPRGLDKGQHVCTDCGITLYKQIWNKPSLMQCYWDSWWTNSQGSTETLIFMAE